MKDRSFLLYGKKVTYELESSYLPSITPTFYDNLFPREVVQAQRDYDRNVRWKQLQRANYWLSRYNLYYNYQRRNAASPIEVFLATPDVGPATSQMIARHQLYLRLEKAIGDPAQREAMRTKYAECLAAFYRLRKNGEK